MSSYRVLSEASSKLRETLWNQFRNDDAIFPQLVASEEEIVFLNPTEALLNSANKLSLWLYRVEENEFIKNSPPARLSGNGGSRIGFPPLGLDLSFLLTPVTAEPETNLNLLGKSMQVLYDNGILPLVSPDEDVREELRIILGRISLEEITRIWEALNAPYRLSVCYRVRVTHVESDRRRAVARIVDETHGYGDLPESGGP